MKVSTELRELCLKLRHKPITLSDTIPLMQKAADTLDEKDKAMQEAIHGLEWSIARIEELEAENTRLMRLLS